MATDDTASPNGRERLRVPPHEGRTVLLTGATGYIGGRLGPRLIEQGYRVRCLTRSREKLLARPWTHRPEVEIVEADAGDADAVAEALRGCDAAYYLVHSMLASGRAYAAADRRLAEAFAGAAGRAGVPRIIYLGGLGEEGERLSKHLTSRREVERALAGSRAALTVFRAAMIIGAGSASFEILRYLVERLPVMVTPRWVRTECQPIAVANVLHYLVACLDVPETAGRTLDIGGPDVVSYRELMEILAEARGLPRRWIIPVPVLTPRLSSLWIHLVTPLSQRIARPLAEGLRNRVVCRDDEATRLLPQRLLGAREAVRAALERTERGEVETSWSDAGPLPGDPGWAGGTVFTDRREQEIAASPEEVYRAVCRIGGGNGWYAADFLWRLRGFLDRLAGGPGLRRGRRDPERVRLGDALDFWRVTGLAPGRRLDLRAEMKLPGEALLSFDIEPLSGRDGGPRSRLVQTARFLPRGLLGILYWYAVLPLHLFVFRGMLQGIRATAEAFEAAAREAREHREARPEDSAVEQGAVERSPRDPGGVS